MSESMDTVSVLEPLTRCVDRSTSSRLFTFSSLSRPRIVGSDAAFAIQFDVPQTPVPVVAGDDWEEDEDEFLDDDDDDDEDDEDDDYFPDDEDDDFDDDDDDAADDEE